MNNTSAQKLWAGRIWPQVQAKMQAVNQRNDWNIPYMVESGRYNDMTEKNISWWTNGFFAGSLWQLFHVTGDHDYQANAQRIEQQLDAALQGYYGLHHDVGFMYLHTAVADYRVTAEPMAKRRGLIAANLLAGRFNVNGHFIRAWNQPERAGWAIVDSLMNLPLLYWATAETGDPRFSQIAMQHADRLLECLMRPDGSVGHIATFDPDTGAFLGQLAGQGYAADSAWARGQAWALYGYALSYHYTKAPRYLEAAKRVANFYIANVAQTDYLSLVDFQAPYQEKKYDASAGLCAACGLLQLADELPELAQATYRQAGYRLLKATVDHWCDFDPQVDGMVKMVSHSYHQVAETHVKIVYGDYFLIEGLLRLMGEDLLLW